MGRWSTGAIHTAQALTINIKDLRKEGITKGSGDFKGAISFSSGAAISISGNNSYLLLSYRINDIPHKTRVNIVCIPSNLGKGFVHYFQCPSSDKRCRILYMAYGSTIFKSREAYQNRIYYPCQMSSKLDRANDRYWELKREFETLDLKYHKPYYNSKLTKKEIRLRKRMESMKRYDYLRFASLAYKVGRLESSILG